MDKVQFTEKSLLLRYESLSSFASEVSQSNTVDDLAHVVSAYVKFIFDAFILRLAFTNQDQELTLECFRGECLFQLEEKGLFTSSDWQYLKEGVPVLLDKDQLASHSRLANTIFNHRKLQHVFILPLQHSSERSVLVQVGSKNDQPYSEIDFRFVRLFGELMTTKISQLQLSKRLIQNNIALQQANEQVARLNSSLESLVEERTQDLKEARDELNTLFYRTSHDFRRPLSAILGLANLMENGATQSEVPMLVDMQKKTLDELNRMLDKLQKISLIEVDTLVEKDICFNELIQGVRSRLRKDLQKYQIRFIYEELTDTMVTSNIEILEAIMESLIENGIHFRGSVNPWIEVQLQQSEDMIEIAVQDNGEGILPAYHQQAFDMYFRASERSGGNGLGLYLVKKLIRRLNGQVWIDPDYQDGARICLQIPKGDLPIRTQYQPQ